MSRKLTNLLNKGKLTGEEVGRLMIKDLLEIYKEARNNPDVLNGKKDAKGILTAAERQIMVDRLDTREDIRAYNEYRALYEYITKDATRLDLYHKEVQIALWRLIHLVSQLKNAEDEYSYTRFDPTIMTQKQYDELKEKEIKKTLENTESIESFIIYALQYHVELYLKGKKTPYNKYFNKAKKELLTNPRIKTNYWAKGEGGYYVLPDGQKSSDFETNEEWEQELNKYPPYSELIEDDTPEAEGLTQAEIILHNREVQEKYKDQEFIKEISYTEAPEDTTKFNVLEYVDGFYYSEETKDNNTFWELKEDYPELYKDLIKNLSSMKGLEFIKGTPEKEYFNSELIKWKDLINNKILDYEKFIKEPHIDGPWSIAILQPHFMESTFIDEEGNYKNKTPAWRDKYRAENFLINDKEVVVSEYEYLISNIKQALRLRETYNIVGDFIGIPEINILLEPVTFTNEINYLNFITERIPEDLIRYGKYPDERPADELKEELKELFIQIKVDELSPKEAEIKRAKRNMKDLSIFKNDMNTIYNILWGDK